MRPQPMRHPSGPWPVNHLLRAHLELDEGWCWERLLEEPKCIIIVQDFDSVCQRKQLFSVRLANACNHSFQVQRRILDLFRCLGRLHQWICLPKNLQQFWNMKGKIFTLPICQACENNMEDRSKPYIKLETMNSMSNAFCFCNKSIRIIRDQHCTLQACADDVHSSNRTRPQIALKSQIWDGGLLERPWHDFPLTSSEPEKSIKIRIDHKAEFIGKDERSEN